jgi:hypothetical protein
MTRVRRAAGPWAALAAASFLLAYANSSTGDYPYDAENAVRLLLHGHIEAAFAGQPLMGSLSIVVRLPFAALAEASGGGGLATYRLGCVPCLFVLGLAGLELGRAMMRAGTGRGAAVAAGAVCLANPLTWEALRLGHPEELLGAGLVLLAALYAVEDRASACAIALGLALATKQWAAIAVVPVLAAASGRRVRIGAVALAIAALLTLPAIAGNARGFYESNRSAAWSGHRVYPWNAVYPLAPSEDRAITVGGKTEVVTVREVPTWVAQVLHPAIVLLAIPLTGAALLVRRRLAGPDVFALLALLFLLRCLLDPVDNAYYHVPFVVSLAFWEGLARRRAPLYALLASAAIYFAIYKAHMTDSIDARNAIYLLATLPFGLLLCANLFRGRRGARPARLGHDSLRAEAPS